MPKYRVTLGDVFTIPVDDHRMAVGQVVATERHAFHAAVYKSLYDAPPDPADAVRDDLLLLGITMDGRLYGGFWKAIGNEPVPAGLPFPAYTYLTEPPDTYEVQDYTQRLRRRATPAEVARLPERTYSSPMLLELAVQAAHGLGEWQPDWDDLKPVAADCTSEYVFR